MNENAKRLSYLLTFSGGLITVIAIIWWWMSYGSSDLISCLYSSCGFAATMVRFGGGTPYNPVVFWIGIGILFLGLFINIVSDPDIEHNFSTKKCPSCAEIIRAEAVRCRFCIYTFSKEEMGFSVAETNRLRDQENTYFCQDCSFSCRKDSFKKSELFCPECGGHLI